MSTKTRRVAWTRESVIEDAKKFDSISEWRKNGSAYAAASAKGWLEEATSHMKRLIRKKWTKEEVYSEVSKYTSIADWIDNSAGSYSAASKNGWLSEIASGLERKIKPNEYWNKARVVEDAKLFNSRSEWLKLSPSASTAAKRNGWYEEATAHMVLLVQHGKWTKLEVFKEAQKFSTKSEWSKKSSTSYNVAVKKGWVSELSAHMVTPSRIRKWTKSAVQADANKYTLRSEWRKAPGGAASAAVSMGWFDEVTAHMGDGVAKYWDANRKWSKKTVLIDALKYKTTNEWQSESSGAYQTAAKNGWLEESTLHMQSVYSFGELTLYKLLTQFDIKFETQKRLPQIKDKKELPFDFYLPDFNLFIEYQGVQHFKRTFRGSASDVSDVQRRDKIKRETSQQLGYEFLEISATTTDAIEEALTQKLVAISNKSGNVLSLTKRNLTDSEFKKALSLGRWTHEKTLEDAKKYKTRSEWKKNNSSAYTAARQRGWLDEATAHMKRMIKPNGYWTKQRVTESAKNYLTRNAWSRSAESAAYDVARANGWLDEACKHMVWVSTRPKKSGT
jgi:hypothetical protein